MSLHGYKREKLVRHDRAATFDPTFVPKRDRSRKKRGKVPRGILTRKPTRLPYDGGQA
jgi:hypothetical protein